MELDTPHLKMSLSDDTLQSIVNWILKERPEIIIQGICHKCPAAKLYRKHCEDTVEADKVSEVSEDKPEGYKRDAA